MSISTAGNKHFQTSRNDNIFHIIDQIKLSGVPLWIVQLPTFHGWSLKITLTVPSRVYCVCSVCMCLTAVKNWREYFDKQQDMKKIIGFHIPDSSLRNIDLYTLDAYIPPSICLFSSFCLLLSSIIYTFYTKQEFA